MIKLLWSCLFIAAMVFAGDSFEEAYTLYRAKEYSKALKEFEKLFLERKDYDAAYILGYMYEHGEGCRVDEKKADYYYKIAARGYYFSQKEDPSRDAKKEQKKLFRTLELDNDSETKYTIKQYTQSLYNIKAHNANYLLPLSYRYGGKYAPVGSHEMKSAEIEFQLSVKYDFATILWEHVLEASNVLDCL